MTRFYEILFNLLALFIAVYMGVDIFYRFVDAQLLTVTSPETAAGSFRTRTMQKQPPPGHYDKISRRGLLGGPVTDREEKAEEMGAEQIAALKPTSLNIVLLGTVSGPQRIAFAVMEEKGKNKQGLYQIGDRVQGALIKKVLRGKVIIEVKGKDEILEMEQAKTGKRGSRGAGAGRRDDGYTITVGHDDLQKSLGNINSLLTQVRIRPLIKNGKPAGLVLSHVKPRSIFAKLGLKNGDVVKKIDNKLIKSPDDAFAFYNRLKSGAELSLEINRGSETKTLNYRFE
ncbi:MAG: PDZ domain-containing protein [Deltaproteobacteria bacterium]|jgi:general secretion pathway protein C|nr:PDZ domain-containing protein [Deltaproteobacteria bacterium]